MAEPTLRDVDDRSLELRIGAAFAAELEEAERDFRPPALRDGRSRSRSLVFSVVAVIAMPIALAAIIATTGQRTVAPSASARGIVPSSSTIGLPSATPSPSPMATAFSWAEIQWPGRVVATFVSEADTLTYDPARHVVWIPVTQSGGPDFLYRYDPGSGETTRWKLPETTYQGVMAQVLVDDSGAVWVNDDGYRVVRFDPDTAKMTSYLFALKVPGVDWANGGTWVSTIAADGDGVLVARSLVPFLVRLGSAATITKTIDLPPGFTGATGLAVADGHLFMTAGGPAAAIARLSLDAHLEARFAVNADRLSPRGDGVVATYNLSHADPTAQILAADGSVTGTIAPPFTFPPIHTTVHSPLGAEVPVTIIVAPTELVNDGHGTSWYLVQNEPVLREYVGPK
jgi:hypothetical protein